MFTFIVSISSIFLAFLIIVNEIQGRINIKNSYLAIYFFGLGLHGLSHFISMEAKNSTLYTLYFNHFTLIYVLLGPAVYLYIQKTTHPNRVAFAIKDVIHLVPFIIGMVDLSPNLFQDFEAKISFASVLINGTANTKTTLHLFFTDDRAVLYSQIVNFIYVFAGLLLVFASSTKNTLMNAQQKVVYHWLKVLSITTNAFFLFMILDWVMMQNSLLNSTTSTISGVYLQIPWYSHTILIINLFLFPTILYGIPPFAFKMMRGITNQNNVNDLEQEEKKISKVFKLEEAYLEKMHIVIQEYTKTIPYTKEKFSLSVLTSDTKIPMHHLNLYFKNYLNTNFNAWKNNLKIKYAVDLINSGILNQITIEALAMKSGFKSYSNFFTVFKAQMKIAPSEYIETLHYPPNNPALN